MEQKNSTINQQVNEQKNNKFFIFCSAHRNKFKIISYFIFIFLCLFMFITNVLPVNSGYSINNFFNTNGIYAVKFNADFTSYIVNFAPAGWIILFLLLFSLVFFAITTFLYLDEIFQKFSSLKDSTKPDKKRYWIKFSFVISLVIIFIILVFFTLIPPNYNELRYCLFLQQQLAIGEQSTDSNIITNILVNHFGFSNEELVGLSIGALKNKLLNVNIQESFWFSPISWYNFGVCNFSFGFWILISFFILFFGYGFLGFLIVYLLAIYPKFNALFKFDLSFVKNWQKTHEENKNVKNKIKEMRKILNEQENKLLKNLYEENLENNNPKISQAELQEKIAKNNEIKKQLDEILAQKARIQKEQASMNRFKKIFDKFNTKKEESNYQRKEKQKITIPDKELDEIFKSLEID